MVFMITLPINMYDVTYTQSFGQSGNFPNLPPHSSINEPSEQLKAQLSLLTLIPFRIHLNVE